MSQPTIWITGASSGIGRVFARHYASQGCRLILAKFFQFESTKRMVWKHFY